MSPTAAARRAYDLETPVVARLEPYGATGGTAGVGTFDGSAGAGTPWTRNFEPGQRFPGGTMAGGLMFLPPELSGSDRLSGFAPSGVTLSTPHFTFGPSTYLALGLPDYKTGGIVSGHRARETAAALTVQRVSASGVATDQVNLPAAGGLQASLDGTVMAGVLLNLANDTVAASTAADTLETGLSVLTLPGGSVTSPGQAVILRAWGTCAANENPKTIRVYSYAGAWTVLATNDVVTNPNGGSWSSSAKIVFQNPVTSQTATGQMATGAAPNSTMTTSPTNLNPANDISFYVTGQNGVASAGDIAFAGFELEVAS